MDLNKVLYILREQNYWDKEVYDLWYIRGLYLKKIIEWFWISSIVKAILWQRRAWKSYIIRQLISYLINNKNVTPANILYINMEFSALSYIKNKNELEKVLEIYRKNIAKWWKI